MGDIKAQIKAFRIGEKIRALRQQKRLTLQELSELTTLSKPLLSQIENQQVIPPLATLLKIAKGLKIDIHFFFEDEGNRQKYVLTRREDVREDEKVPRPVTNDVTRPYTYHSLAQGLRHKHMEPFLVEFDKREWDDALFFKHEGDEEFIYVTDGELDFHYNNEVLRMRAGDSIYYDSSQLHGWVAVGEGKARAVAVMYTKE
ncbi:MAG: Cro/Cl family transcriptional regulator [Geobacteraceae bacterium GWC2_55_20]|nr:MAG: Cro/Cl family transcriptional regulator [Geobacteraceae bacterium GWC2_55_20]OGU24202.1 MAG: Cro/Cl family transcriptional regulator [Geobacteraceae bacterium GWF2_54_21]HBA72965.1 Cro/Cl family transcriptional regulator [Geobacter sp.]HCE69115.1 Cro/Cl family transcriptional regulator [Geobacter sp.]